MKNSRRWMAIVLSMIMIMSFSIMVRAGDLENVQDTYSDEIEKDVKSDLIQVIMPTSESASIFDFILDPQELLYKTNTGGDKKIEEGATLLFKHSDVGEEEADYSRISDAVTITNKGSIPVNLTIAANISVSPADSITLSEDKEFTDDTGASIYLALTDGETTVPIDGSEGANISVTIPAASGEEGNNTYSFRLTGAANAKADWSALTDVVFGVTVTWNITPSDEEPLSEDMKGDGPGVQTLVPATPTDAPIEATPSDVSLNDKEQTSDENREPSIGGSSQILKEGEPAVIKVDLGSGNTAATEVISVKEKATDKELMGDTKWASYSNGQLTLSADYVKLCMKEGASQSVLLEVTFNDIASTRAEIMLEKETAASEKSRDAENMIEE